MEQKVSATFGQQDADSRLDVLQSKISELCGFPAVLNFAGIWCQAGEWVGSAFMTVMAFSTERYLFSYSHTNNAAIFRYIYHSYSINTPAYGWQVPFCCGLHTVHLTLSYWILHSSYKHPQTCIANFRELFSSSFDLSFYSKKLYNVNIGNKLEEIHIRFLCLLHHFLI